MNYDDIFKDDITKKFFYSNYPGNKIIVGRISLNNAVSRLNRDEYYVLVTYKEGEKLPKQYIPLNELGSYNDTLFATFDPNNRYTDICFNGNIKRITKLENSNMDYLIEPGPDKIKISDLINKQYDEYMKSKKVWTTR